MKPIALPVVLVVAVMVAGAAVLGLWLGSRPALSEGDVILRYAERYALEQGGRIEDCRAVPGRRSEIWLIVLCEGAAGRFAYPVDHRGQLMDITEDEA